MVAFIEKKRSSVNDKSNLTDYDLIKTIFDFMISDSKTRPKLENNVLKKECIEVFTKEDSSKDAINYLSNLKYLQQINRKLLKWKEKNLDFTYNTYFNDMSTNYRTTMSKNREDLIVDLGTYSKIIETLIDKDKLNKRVIINLLQKGNIEDENIFKIIDLLFVLEPMRNLEALVSNPMFFELIEKKVYTLDHLPYVLPMAMGGAVDISRKILREVYPAKYWYDNSKSQAPSLYQFIFKLKQDLLLIQYYNNTRLSNNELHKFDSDKIKAISQLLYIL